ncbi:MAG: hypothetical protein KJN99_03465 [Marinicaulis sp.]|nr:hypothetical protein [Marinicaulis sp.]
MKNIPKVFCIGFHKTGTTSLYAALQMLGYRVTGTVAHKWTAKQLREGGAAFCIETIKNFDAAEDMPWPHFFRELDEAYPGSKFILTTRQPEKWFTSIDNHFGHQETELNAFAYGRDKARARDNRTHWIETYLAHNQAVRDFFKDRADDLLDIDITMGDGWAELCPFLGKNEPEAPFPAKNTSAHRTSFAYRIKRKFWLLAGKTPHPERLL